MSPRGVVAVIDDNEELRIALGRLLHAAGYVTALFDSAEAYLAASPPMPDCLLVDLHLPGMSGLDLQRHLRARPNTPRIILTTADPSRVDEAERSGCDAVLRKPLLSETLLSTVASCVAATNRSWLGG